ncbi:glycosyltransferase [Gryllotalpicola ginsengisoli]|uniref:glycosyltransferase n=1 Tax=Gryllotalpicola ginsengisoli TaxID=444608 RepID=UPI0003B3AB8F|nr:glycosyltransferase [Gryllotalpicola ginsengisoli]
MRLVVCSLEDWNEVWRRNQYLVDALLGADDALEVLFVEPPTDPLHTALHGQVPRPARGLRTVPGYGGRLRTLQPVKWLPRQLGPMTDAGLRSAVMRAVARLGWRDPVLWVNDPGYAELVAVTGWRALYDITDDWAVADRSPREHARLRAADAALLERCAEVVVCSVGLAARKGAVRDVVLVPNAVDSQRYRRPAPRPPDLPVGAVALYVGTLHEDRLDVDLVVATARRLAAAGATVALLGPNALSADNTARLDAEPGIRLLGSRPRDAVPAYLQHAHALIVPHVLDDFTDSLDPLKLYEYLAVRRPIVSTSVAGFRELRGQPGVAIADGAAFADAVAAAVGQWHAPLPPTALPEWSDRAREMRAVIDRLSGLQPAGRPR